MIRPTLIDLNHLGLKYYPIMISIDTCTGSCNVLSPKNVFHKKHKTNVNALNMITNKNEARAMTKYISCDCKCKFNSTTVLQIKIGIIKHVNVNVKIVISAKKIIVGILAQVFVRTASINGTSVIGFDKIKSVMDIVSKKITDTIATNVMSTASINYHCKNVKDCYILHTVLSVMILHSSISDHITIDNYYYLLSLCKI